VTEQEGFAEPATPAPQADTADTPGTGPVAGEQGGAEPGTEAPGAAAAEPAEPVQSLTVTGAAEPEPEPEPEPAEPLEAVSATTPEPIAPPFIPDTGVPAWLRDALTWLHERISNLER
jgi:hypothetical protein